MTNKEYYRQVGMDMIREEQLRHYFRPRNAVEVDVRSEPLRMEIKKAIEQIKAGDYELVDLDELDRE